MIKIINRIKKIKVSSSNIKKIIQVLLKDLDYSDFDVGILFTTNNTIQNFNKNFRKKDKPTDVLSFPFHPDLKPGSRIKINDSSDKNLGDLIISLEFLYKDCVRWERSFDEHLKVIIVHGITHLLNYDHQTNKQFEQMNKVEKKLLQAIKKYKI